MRAKSKHFISLFRFLERSGENRESGFYFTFVQTKVEKSSNGSVKICIIKMFKEDLK